MSNFGNGVGSGRTNEHCLGPFGQTQVIHIVVRWSVVLKNRIFTDGSQSLFANQRQGMGGYDYFNGNMLRLQHADQLRHFVRRNATRNTQNKVQVRFHEHIPGRPAA